MIAELFYPKELKEIIADLRSKDDFNEDSLKRINRYIYASLRGGTIVSILFVLILIFNDAGWDYWLLVLAFVVFCPVSVYFSFREHFRKYAYLYNFGCLVEGVCDGYGAFGGSFGMTVVFHQNKRSFIRRSSTFFYRKKYKVGDPVYVVYDSDNPELNAPFIQSIAEVFYLRKKSRHAI